MILNNKIFVVFLIVFVVDFSLMLFEVGNSSFFSLDSIQEYDNYTEFHITYRKNQALNCSLNFFYWNSSENNSLTYGLDFISKEKFVVITNRTIIGSQVQFSYNCS